MAQSLTGMARIMRGYSRVKKLQEKGLDIKEISGIFNIQYVKLLHFVEVCDALAKGEEIFSINSSLEDTADIICNIS